MHLCPIRPVPPVALPFERWGIDFYGPMAETKSGNKYLITCIDYATRWVLAKPVKDMTESAVAAFLYELMMTYGAPFRNHLGSRQHFGLEHTLYWILPFLPSVRYSSSSPTDETPPRNTLAPLDEIERMEENSEFIARNLEEVGPSTISCQCSNKGTVRSNAKTWWF
ncbi:hypothetical protein BASA62_002161 [Batrachochytrium salamandrivorans]|nr:hypothetical protein BASA62_002161 [Batrachochytrium salamandrivorans]